MSLAEGAQRTTTVAIPCALAGVIVGVVAFTGLGTKFTGLIVDLSEGSVVLAVFLTILATLLLGFGMPTTSAYIMAAVLLAPALIQVGFEPLQVHMMLFYFAILSMITPPIALAAYAAAGISGSNPNQTGWSAFVVALPVVLIPLMFLYREELLMIGTLPDILLAVLTTIPMMVAGAAAVTGWFLGDVSKYGRVMLAVAAVVFALPHEGYLLWLVGLALMASGTLLRWPLGLAR